MDDYESLSHSKWECKYRVVFIPKWRRKTLYGELRKYLGEVFRKLAEPKESRIEEGHVLPEQVQRMISIPPKYGEAQVIGFIKGKSAIHLARVYGGGKQNFVGQNFWGADILFRPWGEMKLWSESISASRRKRTSAWIRSTCGAERAAVRRPTPSGAR